VNITATIKLRLSHSTMNKMAMIKVTQDHKKNRILKPNRPKNKSMYPSKPCKYYLKHSHSFHQSQLVLEYQPTLKTS
jgi:hypothetical protein